MKIDNSIKTSSSNAVGETPSRGARPEKDAPGRTAGDSVAISPLSAQMQSLDNALAGTGVVDTAKVEQIKRAISEGQFRVNPDAIADKLLQTVRDMIRAQKAH